MEARGYQPLHVVGRGAFGQAVLVRGPDGLDYVAKKIDLSGLPEAERHGALNEVRLLRKLSHPNVVHMVDSFQVPFRAPASQ